MIAHVAIEGVSPLLQHRFGEEAEQSEQTRAQHREELTPRDKAEQVAYRNPEGFLYLPGAAIARMLREAGGAHKERGSRRSIKYVIPAAVIVLEDTIRLLSPIRRGLKNYEVDSRPVTIPATKGRIMRHRPRLDKWACEFSLEIDTGLVSAQLVHQLLEEGGRRLGVGDFRPEKGGPFGRFAITKWEEI